MCMQKKKNTLVHILFSYSAISFVAALPLRIWLQGYLLCVTKAVTAKDRTAQHMVEMSKVV